MKRYTFLVSFLFFYQIVFSQVEQIILDEDFSDWSSSIIYNDPAGDGSFFGIDFLHCSISHDDQYLFIQYEVAFDMLFQDENKLTIFIDTDNNPNTGKSINGIGAELEWQAGFRFGLAHLNGGTFNIQHRDIGIISSPTVSSNKFEIAIRRDIPLLFGQPFFQGDQIKLVLSDDPGNGADQLPDDNGGISYTFSGSPTTPLPAYSLVRQSSDQLRILSYNVLRDELFENSAQPSHARILNAIVPDIIAYQEIYDHSSGETANLIEGLIPSTPNQNWYHAKTAPDIICLSRYPILASQQISGNGAFLIETKNTYGKNLLLINAHLPCCDNNGPRQLEIDIINAFIRESKAGLGPIPLEPNTAIVVCGDMNLVGGKQQQISLITGDIVDEGTYGPDLIPDWDGQPFADAKPISTNEPLTNTWVNPFSDFSPGRLDYLVYTESILDLKNSFVLNTQSLPIDSLNQYNLLSDDVSIASDHLPIVGDFTFSITTPTVNLNSDLQKITLSQNQPNPFSNKSSITFDIPKNGVVELSLFSADGQLNKKLLHQHLNAGSHSIEIKGEDLESGLYYYILKMDDAEVSRKLMKF